MLFHNDIKISINNEWTNFIIFKVSISIFLIVTSLWSVMCSVWIMYNSSRLQAPLRPKIIVTYILFKLNLIVFYNENKLCIVKNFLKISEDNFVYFNLILSAGASLINLSTYPGVDTFDYLLWNSLRFFFKNSIKHVLFFNNKVHPCSINCESTQTLYFYSLFLFYVALFINKTAWWVDLYLCFDFFGNIFAMTILATFMIYCKRWLFHEISSMDSNIIGNNCTCSTRYTVEVLWNIINWFKRFASNCIHLCFFFYFSPFTVLIIQNS